MIRTLAAATAIALMGAASASALSITGITAQWTDVDPAVGITNTPGGAVSGTSSLRWPAGSTTQSGYDFTPSTTPIAIAPPFSFTLGEFNHLNFPIIGTSLESANLEVNFAFDSGDSATSVFKFTHTETPNNGSPCAEGGSQPCPDLVSFSLVSGSTTSFDFEGAQYVINILGFELPDGSLVDEFLTLENQENEAFLVGTVELAPIPLPAAAWMLIAGLAGLGALSRARRQAA